MNEISELWEEYQRLYLAKYGRYPTISISSKDKLILAILELQQC